MGPPIPVIPAQAGIQGHAQDFGLPPWTPDHVRDDGISRHILLTLRSVASRRVTFLKAPHLQPLLRDGATAPPQDENGAFHPRHARAGGYPGPRARCRPAALDPGSRPG